MDERYRRALRHTPENLQAQIARRLGVPLYMLEEQESSTVVLELVRMGRTADAQALVARAQGMRTRKETVSETGELRVLRINRPTSKPFRVGLTRSECRQRGIGPRSWRRAVRSGAIEVG